MLLWSSRTVVRTYAVYFCCSYAGHGLHARGGEKGKGASISHQGDARAAAKAAVLCRVPGEAQRGRRHRVAAHGNAQRRGCCYVVSLAPGKPGNARRRGGATLCRVQERQGMGEWQHRVASRRRPEARRERHFVMSQGRERGRGSIVSSQPR
jgi:hypothetical protein